ncbi:unnamed protein product [Pleuronectes platessa]|uniref:Uncharacterized protein n=1 Tax=Pleuronectes platessa TaxID=8262 RepID=A0A9N7TZ74_PLEPL|nr:unnamed protein product [Pleuronectes platessa]
MYTDDPAITAPQHYSSSSSSSSSVKLCTMPQQNSTLASRSLPILPVLVRSPSPSGEHDKERSSTTGPLSRPPDLSSKESPQYIPYPEPVYRAVATDHNMSGSLP